MDDETVLLLVRGWGWLYVIDVVAIAFLCGIWVAS